MKEGGAMHPGDLKPMPGSTRRGRYLGRGRSSGHGKTSGRGIKGQFSRTGSDRRPGFMGGELPLILKLPKRGFVSPFKVHYQLVSVGGLATAFETGAQVTPKAMVEHGLISTVHPAVKVLGDGEIAKPLNVSAHAFSDAARQKIEKSGGACALIDGRRSRPNASSAGDRGRQSRPNASSAGDRGRQSRPNASSARDGARRIAGDSRDRPKE